MPRCGGEIYVIGGAAMALAHDARRATRDIDAVFLPHGLVLEEVSTASPGHLLAMKAIAARRRDSDDLRLLVDLLGLTSAEQVVAVCGRVFPDETLPDRARLILADLFEGGAVPSEHD